MKASEELQIEGGELKTEILKLENEYRALPAGSNEKLAIETAIASLRIQLAGIQTKLSKVLLNKL